MKARPTTPRKPKIKAPSPDVSLCETGAKLRHDWAMEIKALPHSGDRIMEQFYDIWGKGYMKYVNHARKCDQCGAYEAQKKLAQDQRFDKKV